MGHHAERIERARPAPQAVAGRLGQAEWSVPALGSSGQEAAQQTLQRALNDGPRQQSQHRLQRMLDDSPRLVAPATLVAGIADARSAASPQTLQRRVRIAGGAPPQAPRGAIVQRILIKVSTARASFSEPRRVTKVQFAERVPTIVSGSQGDHTVAEALVELALEQFCIGKTHAEIAAGLIGLLSLLDEKAQAKYKTEGGTFETATISKIENLAGEYKQAADSGKVEGEDLNEMLANIFEIFLRLWNKRAGSAYARSEGMTFGGGKEKEAKQQIREVAKLPYLEDEEGWKLKLTRNLAHMIDFNVAKGGLEEAAAHVAMAINVALTGVPNAEFYYNDVMTLAVKVFAQGADLNSKDEEALDERVADLIRGKDFDVFEEEDVEESQQGPEGQIMTY